MIWSVSMLAPNFQDRPRMTDGKVTDRHLVVCTLPTNSAPVTRLCAHNRDLGSCDLGREVLQHLARVRDHTRHGARGGDRGVREIDLRLRVPHAAREVAV